MSVPGGTARTGDAAHRVDRTMKATSRSPQVPSRVALRAQVAHSPRASAEEPGRAKGADVTLKKLYSITSNCVRLDNPPSRSRFASPLRSKDRCRFAASPQFPLNLVRDFAKSAAKRTTELRSVDAPEASTRLEIEAANGKLRTVAVFLASSRIRRCRPHGMARCSTSLIDQRHDVLDETSNMTPARTF